MTVCFCPRSENINEKGAGVLYKAQALGFHTHNSLRFGIGVQYTCSCCLSIVYDPKRPSKTSFMVQQI